MIACSMPRRRFAGIKTMRCRGDDTREALNQMVAGTELTVLETRKGTGSCSRGIRPKRPKAGAENSDQPTGPSSESKEGDGVLKLTALIVTDRISRLPPTRRTCP